MRAASLGAMSLAFLLALVAGEPGPVNGLDVLACLLAVLALALWVLADGTPVDAGEEPQT